MVISFKRTAYILGFLLMTCSITAWAQKQKAEPAERKMNDFVSNLMGKMTLDEKIGQLNVLSVGFKVTGPVLSEKVDEKIKSGMVGAVFNTFTPSAVRKLQEMAVTQTRLKIPLLLGFDVIHGHRTIFPMPLALSCTWDMDAVEQSARIAAEEASADGVNWVFSPMVDITRDPRWGRVVEGAGEDTWLGARVAEAMIKGYQGHDLSDYKHVMACVKHFALYGAAESGRDYNTVDMSERRMFQDYLPPYQAAIDAGAGSVMCSFNEINGVPATANKWLLTDLLRKQWGFNGFVATDYTAVSELVAHGVAKNGSEAARQAINAGVDGDMVSELFSKNLTQLVKDGKVSLLTINTACRRILEAKYKLGLFTDPYRGLSDENAKNTLMKAEFRKTSQRIAQESFVLLKNQNDVLPLKNAGSIALIGPLADSQRDMIGNWSAAGDWKQAVSVMQGIQNVAGGVKINYAKGSEITEDSLLLRRLMGMAGN